MLDRLRGFFFGRDVFVSYSYDDSPYAEALAVRLQRRKYSVFLGGWGASPGETLSPKVIRAAERCALLVVVATKSAIGSSAVQQEIDIVSKRQRTVVPINVCGAMGNPGRRRRPGRRRHARRGRRRWPGTDPVPETSTETPSRNVIARIVNATKFVRQEVRLRRFMLSVAIASTLLIVGSSWYTIHARREADDAAAATKRETTIGSALRMANDATLLIATTPSRFSHAAALAAASVKRLNDLGERSLVTDMALRTALDYLPNVRRKVRLNGLGTFGMSANGRFVVSEAELRTLEVFDLDAGTRTALPPYPDEELLLAAISLDGNVVATLSHTSANDLRVRTRSGRDGTEIHRFPEIKSTRGWRSMALSQDGKHVAMVTLESDHYDISVWNFDGSGKPVTLKCDATEPSVFFSPSGKLLLINGQPAMVWDWEHETLAHVSPRTERSKLIVNPADESIVATASHRLAIWNWRQWRPDGKPRWQTDEELDDTAEKAQVVFGADGRSIAWIYWSRPSFVIWSGNVEDGRANYPTQALDASGDSERRAATSIAASTKNSYDFAVSYGDGVVLYREGRPVASLPIPADATAFDRDGSLTSTDSSTACRWSEGTRGRRVNEPQDGSIVVSRSGRVKAASRRLGTEISVSASDAGMTLSEPGKVLSVVFVDDETLVVATAEKKLHVWTWRQPAMRSIDVGTDVSGMAFDPHRRLLLAATRSEVQLWRVDPPAARLPVALGEARNVAFSHSGEYAITIDTRVAHVWSHWYDAPVEIARLSAGSQTFGNAVSAAFIDDDRFVVIRTVSGFERLPWREEDLLAEACPMLGRLIDEADRPLFLEACSQKGPAAPCDAAGLLRRSEIPPSGNSAGGSRRRPIRRLRCGL